MASYSSATLVALSLCTVLSAHASFGQAGAKKQPKARATSQQLKGQQQPTDRVYYQEARAAARKGDAKGALNQLSQAVEKGFYSVDAISSEPDFALLKTQPGWSQLVARARTKQQQYEASFDPALLAVMRKMSYQDQHNRLLAQAADQRYGVNSPQATAAMREQGPVDARLIRQVDSLVAIHGYLGKSKVGEYHKSVMFLVIQHNPDEKYLPMLTAAADKGELYWSSVALLVDRVKTEKGEPQVYGSQSQVWFDGRKQLYPIEDEPNVNVRRAKIGMVPLEVYLQSFGITYQVPTATHNPNPPELYRTLRPKEEASPVELIGGQKALYQALQYPADARTNQISGKVTLQLLIDAQGVPRDVTVVKGLGHGCDEEALRVMRAARFINSSGQDHEIRMSLPFPYEGGK